MPSFIAPLRRRLLAFTCAFCWAAPLLAQPSAAPLPEPSASQEVEPASPPPSQPQLGPAAEDDAAIEAALAADAAAGERPAREPAVSGATSTTQSMNPDLSVIADVAAAYFSQDENLEGGGHDPSHNGFNLQQLELSIRSVVDPYFRFDANLVFALDGVELEEAYATTLDLPWHLQLRAGQFLTRFGRLNSTHLHSWDFVDQPFALTRIFGGEGNRGLGVELSWLSPLPWYVELVGSVTQLGGEESARSFLADDDLAVQGLLDFEYVTALKQFFPLSDDWSLAWGLSGAFGPNSSGRDGGSQVYGTDLYLKWRPITYQSEQQVTLHVEWFYRRRQAVDTVLQDTNGFAALMWRFARRWAVAARYEYGSAPRDSDGDTYPDDLDPEWTDSRQRVSANTTFSPSEFSRIRLQGSVDRPGWKEDPIWAVFLALEVVTGAHGSHPF